MASPLFWGTDLWKTCHRLSLAYPDRPTPRHKQAARQFFGSLAMLLPCAACRRHYDTYYKQRFTAESIASRAALVKWVYDLHEDVNRRLGKPLGTVKIEDLQRLYNAFPRRYISSDGKQLLRTPRYSTVGDDIGFEDKFFDDSSLAEQQKKSTNASATLSDNADEDDEDQSSRSNKKRATTLTNNNNNAPPSDPLAQMSPSLRNQVEATEHASAVDVLADIDSASSVSTTLWIVIGVISALALLLIIAIIACIVVLVQRSQRQKEYQDYYVRSVDDRTRVY